MKKAFLLPAFLCCGLLSMAQSNPAITSWLRNNTGIKGRHYLSGNSIPINDNVLANVQSVQYATNWVYVGATGIPAYITGPFLDGNPSLATAQTGFFKISLNPVQNTGTPTATTGGNIGAFINGVALFDYRDGVGWNSTLNTLCGGPGNPPCPGGPMAETAWNRDAIRAERGGFDCAKAHPAMGNYHHHQNPSAFNLDLVVISNICDLYPADGLYVINPAQHSPLIGFAYDGFPIYGAYGYKNADGTGGVVRIKSSYQLRNISVRTHHADGTDVADGPVISATYPLGYFREDYEFIAHGEPDFLDVHNGRFCVTPEYPNGIYCYFATVDANWNSAYPYVVGPTFYGIKNATKVQTISESVTTYNGPPITALPTVTPVNCFGNATGAISLAVDGGNPPYSYNWGSGITTQHRTGLIAGTYTVTITDVIGITATKNSIVTEPTSALMASAMTQSVNCFGDATGAVQLTVAGGTAGYSFVWSDGGAAQNRSALLAGMYDVTVTDSLLCTTTVSTSVMQPAAMLSAAATGTNVACFGNETGAIQLTVAGGTSNYSVLWNDGNTDQNRTMLPAGVYTATITDAHQCTTTITETIAQPLTGLEASASVMPVACFGNETGDIQLNIQGGTTGYAILWNDGNTMQNRSSIPAGVYAVTITDAHNCSVLLTETIAQPNEIIISAEANAATCNEENGSITLSAQGGVLPYAYQWSAGANSQNITNLPSGLYTVTLTDANGCTMQTSAAINSQNGPVASTEATPVNCFGEANGAINLSVTGGTAPFSFQWNDGATEQNRSDLVAGTYIGTIQDANNCTTIVSVEISQPEALAVTAIGSPDACGQSNGSIALNATGGIAPYTYTWSNGMTTQSRSGLAAGDYAATISDAHSCSLALVSTISQASGPVANATPVPVACFAGSTGQIQLNVSQGAPPFSYHWNNGSSSQNQTGLGAGTYAVTITDANGCTTAIAQTVTQPGSALSVIVVGIPVACFGDATGTLNLMVNGGASPYTLLWSNGQTSPNLTQLTAGTYSAVITDASGCTIVTTQTLGQPNALAVTTISSASSIANDGTASANGAGGTPPYAFNWSNGMTGNQLSNLAPGSYTVTITDANGCVAVSTATVDFLSANSEVLDNMGLKIFPNPTSDVIMVQAQSIVRQTLLLELVNAAGEVVRTVEFYQGTTICHVETSTLYEGVYFLQIKDGSAVKVFKVVITR